MASELPGSESPTAASPSPAVPDPAPAGAGDEPPARPAELESAARLQVGAPARARLAASVIVVRDGAAGVEVLLVKRNPAARFMGGVWVFPGGAVDPADGDGEPAHRAAAVRELTEEAGIGGVDPAALVRFSRWITPAELAVRFDTHFFVAVLPAGETPQVDGHECVADAWFTAEAALHANADGRILLVFPTIRQLEELRPFTAVADLIDYARRREVTTARPRMLVSEGEPTAVVMPGDPGYDPA